MVMSRRARASRLSIAWMRWCRWFALWTCFTSGIALAADITVRVEPDPPAAGESFRLIFDVQGEIDGEPDFSPLQDTLEILGRNQQTSIQWINGRHTRTASFVLEVLAKQPGTLDIPPIDFGATRSPAKRIELAEGAAAAGQDDGLLLEVDATPRDPYVQEQVTYTIRLWRRYELSNASLSEPQMTNDALVKPLGDDRHFEAERDGKRYEVIERRYAIFPQKSGEATIQPVTVTAQVLQRASSLFEMFGRAVKTKRISAQPLTLRVKPVPPNYPAGAVWLPARKVRLNETWEPGTLQVAAGDPITRTVSLWAEGLTSGQLPELQHENLADFKVYPDQAQLRDETKNGYMTAVRQERAALIPENGGAHPVPVLEIPWWNTEVDKLEVARLDAQTIQAQAPTSTAKLSSDPSKPQVQRPMPVATPSHRLELPAVRQAWWAWDGWVGVSALLACGLVVSLRRGRREVHAATDTTERVDTDHTTEKAARATVLAACRANELTNTRRALLTWARVHWPVQPPLTLGALARQVSPPLAHAIESLEAACFRPEYTEWKGDELATALSAEKASTARPAAATEDLPALFKLVRS